MKLEIFNAFVMLKSYEERQEDIVTGPPVCLFIFQIKLTMTRSSTHISKIKIFLTSFLRYPENIANLSGCFGFVLVKLFKKDNINLQKTLTLISMQKINFTIHFFLEILQQYYILILNTLNMRGHAHQIW